MVVVAVLATALGAAGILAQEAEPAPDNVWLYVLDRYGLPIAFLALVLLIGRFLYERRVAELYACQERLESLETSTRESIVPAMVKSAAALESFARIAERLERRLDEERR